MKKISILLLITCLGLVIFLNIDYSKSDFTERLVYKNIEAMAQKEEKPIHIRKCYRNEDVLADEEESQHDICNPLTTSTDTYKCKTTKRGSLTWNAEINVMHCTYD